MKLNIIGLLSGIAFGGILAGGLLHEYDTIHSTLALEDPYVFLFMGSAIAVSAPILWLLERRGANTLMGGRIDLARAKPEPHHIKGGRSSASAGRSQAPAQRLRS